MSSCEDANIVVIKKSPGASNPILEFFLLCTLFMNLACALGCRTWIDALVA
jgi:hypothetical protein